MSVTVTGNVQGVNPAFLSAVIRAVSAVGGTAIRVTSGFRTAAQNTAAGGVSESQHLTGHALDGDVYIPGSGWIPLGTALKGAASRFGLRSGDQPGFFNGAADPVHVDAGVTAPSTHPVGSVQGTGNATGTTGGGTPWQTEFLNLLRAPQTPANYQFLNQWATREHSGGPAMSDGSNNPFFTTAGAGGTVGPLHAGTFPSWNSIGVAKYPTLGVGVWANALHVSRQYPAILRALKSGNPSAYANDPSFQSDLTKWSGGGYASFASIQVPAGPVGPTVDPSKLTANVAKAVNGGSGGGFVNDVVGYIGKAVSGAPIPGVVGGTIGGAVDAVTGVAGGVTSVADFLGKITSVSFLLRALQIMAGAGLVGMGTLLLVRQVALAADFPDPLAVIGKSTASTFANATPSGQGGTPGDEYAVFEHEPGATRQRAKPADLSPAPKPVYRTR